MKYFEILKKGIQGLGCVCAGFHTQTYTLLKDFRIVLISCSNKVTVFLFFLSLRLILSPCHTLYGLHTNYVTFSSLLYFFFLVPKCKFFHATLQGFSPLMIWREITPGADRGKSSRISNTSAAEWCTASGSKLQIHIPKH